MYCCLGLFHQAIFQSGADLAVWAVNGPERLPETYIYGVAEQVGCGNEDDNEAMLNCMRALPALDLFSLMPDCPVRLNIIDCSHWQIYKLVN